MVILRFLRPVVMAVLLTSVVSSAWADGSDDNPDLRRQSLDQLMGLQVVSAALHDQNLADAPGDVTVITAEQIRRWGYRTLADALAYVRGFYISSDRTFTYVGLRGFSLPGDYETRILVLINGHNLTDNIFDMAAWYGDDFPLDLNLVERIEVVRGASSALYGSNGMLATINVITKRPADAQGITVRTETDNMFERKMQASMSVPIGKTANLLVSTSVFNNPGAHDLYFSEFDTPQTNYGRAINMNGDKGYHVFADLTWGNWEALGVAGDSVEVQPFSWGPTIFNDRGSRAENSRGFLDLSYTRDLPGDRTLSWHTSYDEYRFRGIYRYPLDGAVDDSRENDYGDWFGSKLTYRLPDSKSGHLTVGSEVRMDMRALNNLFDVKPVNDLILRVNNPDRYVGTFAQQEWEFGRWEVNLGGRYDWSWLRRSSLSPRAALIYKPSSKSDLKLLYGRGFRNPSTFELFWENGLSQLPNPALRPETTNTFEFDADDKLSNRLRAAASIYHYQVSDLIQQTYTSAGLIQYVNAERVRAAGASFELSYDLPQGMQLSSSLELQRAVSREGFVLPNSPGQVGKFRFSLPFWRDRLTLGIGLQALGQRRTLNGLALPWVVLPDAVISTKQLRAGLEFSAGVKNLSNSLYRDPVGLNSTIYSIVGNRRVFYTSLTWHSSREREIISAGSNQSATRSFANRVEK